MLRVIVAQHGHRHRYMVARILEEAGCLERLYTDTTGYSHLGALLRVLRRGRPLRDRTPPDIPRAKVFSSDLATLARLVPRSVQRAMGFCSPFDLQHRLLSFDAKRWGVGNANWIYTMFDESLPFIRYAKHAGMKVAVDLFISPLGHRDMIDEAQKAGVSLPPGNPWNPSAYERNLRDIFSLADILLCPSEWVQEGLHRFAPQDAEKARLVPYGVTLPAQQAQNEPEVGRILFSGRDAFRKGLAALVTAAHRARQYHPCIRVRVAGRLETRFPNLAGWADVEVLGELKAEQMAEEYRKADVFVLPTLGEGLAGVVVEALAAGVPVVTTNRAGVDIRDGESGFLIEPGDVDGLAEAINRIVTDRVLRDRLSRGARALSQRYTIEAWRERLLACLADAGF